ncbi:MAG: hypothetical protein AAGF95_19830 [Chloroflexota bacterium]
MLSFAMLWACNAPASLNKRSTATDSTSSIATSDVEQAHEVLETCLTALDEGRYVGAAALYGATYATLQEMNPSVDREDYSALFANACEFNGYQCLAVHSVTLEEAISSTDHVFLVEFTDNNGKVFRFTLPPGSPDEPRTHFPLTFMQKDEVLRVLELPQYVS